MFRWTTNDHITEKLIGEFYQSTLDSEFRDSISACLGALSTKFSGDFGEGFKRRAAVRIREFLALSATSLVLK
jgi:hypothetical protein